MAGTNQFTVSMKFVGIDASSTTIKKISDQVKGLKSQMQSFSNGPAGGFKFLDDLSKGFKNASKSIDDLQKKLDKMKSSGFGDIIAGGAMIAPVMNALKAAGDMQTKMVTISGATGVTDTKPIQEAIRAASNVTKFSSLDVADLAVKLATSGMTGDQVKELTPVMAKFAEVQQFGKGSSPQEAVTQAISAAHMLGIYDPQQLDSYLNKFNKATFMTPGSTSEFFDTFKYLSPTAKGLGMSNDDILYTSALANRVGLLGSMGGTEAADMILRSIPGIFGGMGHVDKNGKLKPSQQLKAMMDLGLANADGSSVFYNNKGEFLGIENFIKQLSDHSKNVNPEQLMKDYKAMFGMQGERLAVILGERGGEQLQLIEKQMESMKSITQLQDDYNKSYEGQLAQFKTNLQNLNQDVGEALLPTATHLLNIMQPYVTQASQWIQTHQDEVAKIGKVVAELGGLLLAIGAAKLAIGGIGSFVIEPLKAGIGSLATIVESVKAKSAALSSTKEIPTQSIQANIVNVYGASVTGGGGGPAGVISSESKKPILDSKGNPIVSTSTSIVAEEAKKTGTASKMLEATKNVANATKSGVKGGVYAGATAGVYDLATGQGIKAASKDAGNVMGVSAGMYMGAAIGAELGAVGGPIGMAAGGIIGGALGAWAGETAVKGIQAALFGWLKGDPLQQYMSEYTDRSKYTAQEAHFYRKQAQMDYNDNSTHIYQIQATSPQEVADEINGRNQNGNFSRKAWYEQGASQ